MSTPQEFRFSLTAFDHRQACARLTRRLLPGWLRLSFLPLFALMFVPYPLSILARNRGLSVPPILIFAILVLAWVALLGSIRLRRKRLWAAVQNAPLRRDMQQVSTDDHGITFRNPVSTLTVTWSALLDVLDTPGGLLILLGDMDYQPIPATAFADRASQTAFAAGLRARIAAAQRTMP